jgi:hypothetical protein
MLRTPLGLVAAAAVVAAGLVALAAEAFVVRAYDDLMRAVWW